MIPTHPRVPLVETPLDCQSRRSSFLLPHLPKVFPTISRLEDLYLEPTTHLTNLKPIQLIEKSPAKFHTPCPASGFAVGRLFDYREEPLPTSINKSLQLARSAVSNSEARVDLVFTSTLSIPWTPWNVRNAAKNSPAAISSKNTFGVTPKLLKIPKMISTLIRCMPRPISSIGTSKSLRTRRSKRFNDEIDNKLAMRTGRKRQAVLNAVSSFDPSSIVNPCHYQRAQHLPYHVQVPYEVPGDSRLATRSLQARQIQETSQPTPCFTRQ